MFMAKNYRIVITSRCFFPNVLLLNLQIKKMPSGLGMFQSANPSALRWYVRNTTSHCKDSYYPTRISGNIIRVLLPLPSDEDLSWVFPDL